MFITLLLVCLAVASAFSPMNTRSASTSLTMKNEFQKIATAGLLGASIFAGGLSPARAEVDYDGIKYLGGGEKVDLNNANIRAYLKVQ